MYRRQAPIFLQRQDRHAIRNSSKLQISLSSGAIRFGQIILDATICNRLSPKNMRKLRISWTGSDASRQRGRRERGQAYSPPLKIKSALTPCSPNYRKACTALWHRAWLYILCLLSHIRHFSVIFPVSLRAPYCYTVFALAPVENRLKNALGESPSRLRHRILIPAFEGSNPSSPAKLHFSCFFGGLPCCRDSNE